MERAIEASASVQAALERLRVVLDDEPGTLATAAPTAEERRARRALQTYVQEVAARLDREVARRTLSAGPPPVVGPTSARDTVGSENYIG